MLSLSDPTIRTAIHHVIKVATNARPAPKATGRRCRRFGPVILAVIAANTRMHSNPSRKTRTPMSRNATVGLVLGRVGSGAPCAVTPCQISTAITKSAAATAPMRRTTFISAENLSQRQPDCCRSVAFFLRLLAVTGPLVLLLVLERAEKLALTD